MDDPHPPNNPTQVARFVGLFDDTATSALVGDAQAEVSLMAIGDQAFAVTMSDPTPSPNCYLCSPTTAYVDYAIAEAGALNISNAAKRVMCLLIRACAPLVRATGLDEQIQINNWMVSTNPVPWLSAELVDAIKDSCLATHPNRAIVIRSLNDAWDQSSMDALQKAGFRLLAARQIYVLPKDAPNAARDVKRDAKLLADTPFEIVKGCDLTVADFVRCADLYRALYLEKHTTLNPHYTARFLADLQTSGVMEFVALRCPKAGIVGFTGLFESVATLTQPFVGYDTTRPQDEGLYRMLMHIGRAQAQDRGLRYNLSAGAAGFKRNRGAAAAIEFSAVFVAHRPWRMRAATRIVEFAARHIGVPLVKRFDA